MSCLYPFLQLFMYQRSSDNFTLSSLFSIMPNGTTPFTYDTVLTVLTVVQSYVRLISSGRQLTEDVCFSFSGRRVIVGSYIRSWECALLLTFTAHIAVYALQVYEWLICWRDEVELVRDDSQYREHHSDIIGRYGHPRGTR